MTKDTLQAIRAALAAVSSDDRRRIFQDLRKEFPIHELERKWNAPADVVLEAIARATDLTQRGLRGVIAEAAFGPPHFLLRGGSSEQPEIHGVDCFQDAVWRDDNRGTTL